jgi:polyribonucleotide nucleotidyltransferase
LDSNVALNVRVLSSVTRIGSAGLESKPQAGKTYYNCEVKTVVDFGVFVELLPGKDGLVHVSELAHERVEDPNDFAAKGDRMDVVLLEVSHT